MPNLFSTFGRAALVALGLAVAPAAFAQLTCPSGMSPLVTGVGTQSVEAVCGLACTSGQVVSVDGNGNYSCSTGTPTNAAPSGCTLTATPTSGLSGAGTTLKAKCTAGYPTALTLTWTTPSGTQGSCSGTGTVGVEAQCPVTNITAGTTFSVKFSNTIPNDVTKTAAYSVTAGGGGGGNFANCPSGSITSSNFYPKATDQSMADFGSVGAGKFFSFKMTVPANANVTSTLTMKALASYGSTGAAIRWNISETACDINPANGLDFGTPIVDAVGTSPGKAVKYMKGYMALNLDGKAYSYGPAGTQTTGPLGVSGMKTMEIGKTYYFNILYDACPSGGCSLDSLKLP